MYRALKSLLEFDGDVESTYMRTFSEEYDFWGSLKVDELKENGSKIPLNNDNRTEYVDLYLKWLFETSIQTQFEAFKQGFDSVCANPLFHNILQPIELEELVCGSSEVDFFALEKGTLYDSGYTKDSRIIRDFWSVVHEMNDLQRRKFLAFCTGTDRVPVQGLGKIEFVISRNGPDSDQLPTSHTCFNHLLLPEYSSREKLKTKLLASIENSEGFGLM